MKKFVATLAAVQLAFVAPAAVVTYTLTGVGEVETMASGSFSFDTTTIGANYDSMAALGDLLSFEVTLTNIGGLGGTTSFSISDPSTDPFRLATDGTGAVSRISPGFDENPGGWSLSFFEDPLSISVLDGPLNDLITWSFVVAVPELGATVPLAAVALAGFALVRARARRRG